MKKKSLFLTISLLSAFSLASCAKDGHTPEVTIGENGNWFVDGVDQGVPAQGEKGTDGKDGKDGTNGVSVVSISKTNTANNVDTYTITYSDNTTSTFTVTNGTNGKDGKDAEALTVTNVSIKSSANNVDTYEIVFSDGYKSTFTITNGKDGENLSVVSIEKESTDGKYDTYKISFSDTSYQTFIVKNGEDGLTPYIGDNGNWWIGNEDTGVMADGERANEPLDLVSSGLQYKTLTLDGKTGFVVTGWDEEDFETYLYAKYGEEWYEETYEDLLDEGNLVIPNYVGTMPVIGIAENAKLNFKKVTLSKNTIFLGASSFENCSNLEEIDFNGSKILAIPNNCFSGTKITSIELPNTVTHIFANAFKGCKLKEFDFTNIKHIGANAFDSLYCNYVYLPKTVERVDDGAFASTRVYTEHETKPSAWGSNITSSNKLNSIVSYNCKMNDEYIYSVDSNEVTVYQYIGNENEICVPSKIDNYNVTKVGFGFASAPFKANDIWSEKYKETGDVESIVDLKEVRLPDGLKEIGYGAFFNVGMMIMIPASVTKVNESLFWALDDIDDIMYLMDTNFYANKNYLAFAGSTIDIYDEIDSSRLDETINSSSELNGTRVSFNNDFDKFEHDESFYYVDNGASYSLLAYMRFGHEELTVPASFNNKQVTTILSSAITCDYTLKRITFADGITTVRPYAIAQNEKLTSVYIPNSVSLINANGMYTSNEVNIYAAAESKPMDWDTNWTKNYNHVYFNVGTLVENNMFIYSIKNNQISLLKYNALTTNVYIPSEIDGYPVTEIRTGFYPGTRGATVLIPNSVTRIQANAFQNPNSKQFNIYCQAESKPADWDSDWKYSNINVSFNQSAKFNYLYTDNYEYAYLLEDNNITLLAYYGKDSVIKIPRQIDGKNVTKISSYCFTFNAETRVYIPNNITIQSYGFDNSAYNRIYIYSEATSRPSSWNSYAFYNTAGGSENYYFTFYYSQTLDY